MSARGLWILIAAAVLAVGGGLWLAHRQAATGGGEARAALYPGLGGELDDVTAVRIYKAGDERTVELRRGEDGWIVAERAGYRADTDKLGKLLVALGKARLFEEKTSKPDQYAMLEVEDTSAKDAQGVRIELEGTPTAVNLIVGKPGMGSDTHYVRRAGEATSWLVDQRLDAPSDPTAWLERKIADVQASRLPDSSTALSNLTLTDVQAASAFEGEKPSDRAEFRTSDGLVVRLKGWKKDAKRFVALEAAYEPPPANAPEAESREGGEKAETSAPATPPRDVEAEARALSQQTAGWVYEIPSYRYDTLFEKTA